MVTFVNNFFRLQSKKDAASQPGSHRSNETVSSPPPPAMQGDIGIIALENVFQLFDLAALTGKLEIESPTDCGIFYFRNGALIHGLLRINQRKIGQLLLEAQVITQEQLDECLHLHEQSSNRQRFGQLLIEKGYVKPGWLDKSLLTQVKEAFFATLSWQEGSFRFYPNQLPEKGATQFYTRIDHLLLEGMMAIDEHGAPDGGDDE